MRIVVQRVKEASVIIDGKEYSAIKDGLLVLLGIMQSDGEKEIRFIADKIVNLRIFADENGVMNKSVKEIQGEIMIVSQFTLYADAQKGRRPSYSKAASGEIAKEIYDNFINYIKTIYDKNKIATGVFQAMMQVKLTNDGPVTIIVNSK